MFHTCKIALAIATWAIEEFTASAWRSPFADAFRSNAQTQPAQANCELARSGTTRETAREIARCIGVIPQKNWGEPLGREGCRCGELCDSNTYGIMRRLAPNAPSEMADRQKPTR